MTYKKNKSIITDENTITVNVDYTFDDNSTQNIDVPIFITADTTLSDIETSLENRGISEQANIVAKDLFAQKAEELLALLNS